MVCGRPADLAGSIIVFDLRAERTSPAEVISLGLLFLVEAGGLQPGLLTFPDSDVLPVGLGAFALEADRAFGQFAVADG